MDAVMYDMMMISSIVLLTIFKSSNGVYIQKECEMESSFQQTLLKLISCGEYNIQKNEHCLCIVLEVQ